MTIPSADVERVIAGLSEAQKRDLLAVCKTRGGGLRIRCRVRDDGYGEPISGPMKKLYDKGLIQGKSGACEMVVHTREGWTAAAHLQQPGQPKGE